MKLVKKLLNKLNGLHYPQEYLCLANESFKKPLYIYLVENGQVIKDITKLHSLVGYSPLLFAFSSATGIQADNIDIAFSNEAWERDSGFSEKKAIALLSMKKIYKRPINGNTLIIYEGLKGSHHFLSPFHQFIIQLNNNLYNHKPGNVFLKGNLYTQVQVAYSVPRKISLITVGQNNLFNHFPTDLHGAVNDQYYLISLRHGGNACSQVETAKQIVISDIHARAFKMVYALGKNHMQPLKERTAFDFDTVLSKEFQLPLPKNLLSYKELVLVDSFTHGIHKLLLFQIIHHKQVSTEAGFLVHIHNSYATWRDKNGLESNYLLR